MDPWQSPLPSPVEESIGRHLLEGEKRLWHLAGKDFGQIYQTLVATDRRLLIVKVNRRGGQESVHAPSYRDLSFVAISFDLDGIFQVVRTGLPALSLKRGPATSAATSMTFDGRATAMFRAAADSINQTISATGSKAVEVTISGSVPLRAEDIPAQIRKLTDLRDHGHLSQREYDKKRLELLDRL